MTDKTKPKSKRHLPARIFFWGSVIFLILTVLSFSLIISLPKIVSTDYFKNFIENQISKSIKRPVYLKKLGFMWSKGIIIEGLHINGDPVFSLKPIFSFEKARVSVHLENILNGQLSFDLNLTKPSLNLIRNKNNLTNLEVFLANFNPDEADQAKSSDKDFFNKTIIIPFDIKTRIRITEMTINVEDLITEKSILLTDALLDLDIPSLYERPIVLDAKSNIAIMGRVLDPFNIKIIISQLTDPKGMINLKRAVFDMYGNTQGTRFQIKGNLQNKRISSRMDFNIEKLLQISRLFPEAKISLIPVSGHIRFELDASGDEEQTITFKVSTHSTNLRFADVSNLTNPLNPVDFKTAINGKYHVKPGHLLIDNGELHILDNNQIKWQGEIKGINSGMPTAELDIGPVKIHVNEIERMLQELIPGSFPLLFEDTLFPSVLSAEKISISGGLDEKDQNISVKNLSVCLPDFQLNSPSSAISCEHLDLTIFDLKSNFTKFIPKNFNLKACLNIDVLKLKGDTDASIHHLKLPDIDLNIRDIHKSTDTPLGWTSRFSLNNKVKIDKLNIRSLLSANDIDHTLVLDSALLSGPNATVDLHRLKISAANLVTEIPEFDSFETAFSLESENARINIPIHDPLKLDISDLNLKMIIDDMLKINFQADVKKGASRLLTTKGAAFFNLTRLSEKLHGFFPEQIKLTGMADIDWILSGRLPDETQMKKLSSIHFFNQKENLSFLEDLAISFRMKDIDFIYNDTKPLKITNISTKPSLTYMFNGETAEGEIQGGIHIEDINSPSQDSSKEPKAMDFSFSGHHKLLESVSFSQALTINSMNLKETFNISIDNVDTLFDGDFENSLPLWLKNVNGNASFTLDVKNGKNLAMLKKDLSIDGGFKGEAEIFLVPNQMIGFQGRTTISEMDMKVTDLINIKSAKANLDLSKQYIIQNDRIPKNMQTVPLSVKVMQEILPDRIASEDQGGDWRKSLGKNSKRVYTQNDISFETLILSMLPSAFEFSNSIINFELDQGLPQSKFFQFDLMGGTVIGTFTVIEKKGVFYLEVDAAFTGINPDQKNIDKNFADRLMATELSGQIRIQIPVTPQLKHLVNELQLDLTLSHIGARALDRLLYAMDPFESNETIMSQRRLLKAGTPREISIKVKNGHLTLDGHVDVKGLPIKIPHLERLSLSNLSGFEQYENHLKSLEPLIKVLKTITASSIILNHDGSITFTN